MDFEVDIIEELALLSIIISLVVLREKASGITNLKELVFGNFKYYETHASLAILLEFVVFL